MKFLVLLPSPRQDRNEPAPSFVNMLHIGLGGQFAIRYVKEIGVPDQLPQ
jgi:hypothetical protein